MMKTSYCYDFYQNSSIVLRLSEKKVNQAQVRDTFFNINQSKMFYKWLKYLRQNLDMSSTLCCCISNYNLQLKCYLRGYKLSRKYKVFSNIFHHAASICLQRSDSLCNHLRLQLTFEGVQDSGSDL